MKSRNGSIAVVIAIALLWLVARVSLDVGSAPPEAPVNAGTSNTEVVDVAAPAATPAPAARASSPTPGDTQALPDEAWQTVALIQRGGPFPHRQDGTVFGNRERLLPLKPRGYYREYTVETPGLRHRGTRRIVTGGQPPDVWYYSDDHYQSFRKFTP